MGNWTSSALSAVDGGRLDMAARYLVVDRFHSKRPETVWTWWKRKFGKRKDYAALTRKLVEALLSEYQTAGQGFQETVVRILGLQRKRAGAFNALPKHPGFQVDIEEFDGMWAWPRSPVR